MNVTVFNRDPHAFAPIPRATASSAVNMRRFLDANRSRIDAARRRLASIFMNDHIRMIVIAMVIAVLMHDHPMPSVPSMTATRVMAMTCAENNNAMPIPAVIVAIVAANMIDMDAVVAMRSVVIIANRRTPDGATNGDGDQGKRQQERALHIDSPDWPAWMRTDSGESFPD